MSRMRKYDEFVVIFVAPEEETKNGFSFRLSNHIKREHSRLKFTASNKQTKQTNQKKKIRKFHPKKPSFHNFVWIRWCSLRCVLNEINCPLRDWEMLQSLVFWCVYFVVMSTQTPCPENIWEVEDHRRRKSIQFIVLVRHVCTHTYTHTINRSLSWGVDRKMINCINPYIVVHLKSTPCISFFFIFVFIHCRRLSILLRRRRQWRWYETTMDAIGFAPTCNGQRRQTKSKQRTRETERYESSGNWNEIAAGAMVNTQVPFHCLFKFKFKSNKQMSLVADHNTHHLLNSMPHRHRVYEIETKRNVTKIKCVNIVKRTSVDVTIVDRFWFSFIFYARPTLLSVESEHFRMECVGQDYRFTVFEFNCLLVRKEFNGSIFSMTIWSSSRTNWP